MGIDVVINDIVGRLLFKIPTEIQDQIALYILFIFLPIGIVFEFIVILPTIYECPSKEWYLRVVLLMYMLFIGYMNAFKAKYFGPNGCTDSKFNLPTLLKPGFHYCHNCNLNQPPRSHHCSICNKCAHRRDHHCSFIAECIGHYNQRFYFITVLNFLIVSAVIVVWNWLYMWFALGDFSITMLWQIIVPHLALIFRVINFYQFLKVLVFVTSLTTFLFLLYLTIAQLFCICRGQTRTEYLLDIKTYDRGFLENTRQALGQRWFIFILFPFVLLPLQSDGITFATKEFKSTTTYTKDL